MNEFQAAMGLCNLEGIDEKIRLRKKIYEFYEEKLCKVKGIKFQKIIASKHNYAYMPVCFGSIEKRDAVNSKLIMNGIKPRKYFFPLTVNFNYFKEKGVNLVENYGLDEAAKISNTVLCLPIYPDLEMSIVEQIIRVVSETLP